MPAPRSHATRRGRIARHANGSRTGSRAGSRIRSRRPAAICGDLRRSAAVGSSPDFRQMMAARWAGARGLPGSGPHPAQLGLARCARFGPSAVLRGPVAPARPGWLRCLWRLRPRCGRASPGFADARSLGLALWLGLSAAGRPRSRSPAGAPRGGPLRRPSGPGRAYAPALGPSPGLALGFALAAAALAGARSLAVCGLAAALPPRPGSPLPPPPFGGFGASLGSPGGVGCGPGGPAWAAPPPPPRLVGLVLLLLLLWDPPGGSGPPPPGRGAPGGLFKGPGSPGGLTGSPGTWYSLGDGWSHRNWIWAAILAGSTPNAQAYSPLMLHHQGAFCFLRSQKCPIGCCGGRLPWFQ